MTCECGAPEKLLGLLPLVLSVLRFLAHLVDLIFLVLSTFLDHNRVTINGFVVLLDHVDFCSLLKEGVPALIGSAACE